MKVKQSILKSEEAIDCMVTDSLKNDIKDVCRAQRELTNTLWVRMLESAEAMKLVARILEQYITDRLTRERLSIKILTSFTRNKPLQTLAQKPGEKQAPGPG